MLGLLFNKLLNNFFKKRDSNTGVSYGNCEIFKNSFLYRKPAVAASKSPTTVSKVSWGICSLFWFCVFTCFRIWLKTYAKRCTNNSLLLGDKTISFLLELIYHVFSISECFGKTLVAFDFDEKLTQSIAQITMFQIAQKTNITCQKTFFACTLRLINFRTWFGKRRKAV